MDGMPLTLNEIKTFISCKHLEEDIKYLTKSGYLRFEHPKEIKIVNGIKKRVYKTSVEKGYNIVSGKLSFPISKILDPDSHVPTIVATEIGKLAVATKNGVRSINVNEGIKFFGFPSSYNFDNIEYKDAFDLLGNTVIPPVIKYVTKCLIDIKNDVSK